MLISSDTISGCNNIRRSTYPLSVLSWAPWWSQWSRVTLIKYKDEADVNKVVIKIITEKQSLFLSLLDVPCVLYHQADQEDHRNHGRPVKDTDINISIISL